MIIKEYETNQEWIEARKGKVTGTKVKGIIDKIGVAKGSIEKELENLKIEYKKSSNKRELEKLMPEKSMSKLRGLLPKKIGYYELIAEKLSCDDGIELDPMDRGVYLEEEALQIFADDTGKELDTRKIICMRKDNENIAFSPDSLVKGEDAVVEVKCLGSARHIEAYITKKIPSEHMEQAIQPFIVSDKIETLYFVFYDPRMPDPINYFFIELKRSEIKKEIKEYHKYQVDALKEINQLVAKLTNF